MRMHALNINIENLEKKRTKKVRIVTPPTIQQPTYEDVATFRCFDSREPSLRVSPHHLKVESKAASTSSAASFNYGTDPKDQSGIVSKEGSFKQKKAIGGMKT